jgi:hypothetical protein
VSGGPRIPSSSLRRIINRADFTPGVKLAKLKTDVLKGVNQLDAPDKPCPYCGKKNWIKCGENWVCGTCRPAIQQEKDKRPRI